MRELVTELGAVMLRHMLKKPKGLYYCKGLADELGYADPSVRSQLRKLEAVGWMTSANERRGANMPRRNYRFTPDGIEKARAELKQWKFTDA